MTKSIMRILVKVAASSFLVFQSFFNFLQDEQGVEMVPTQETLLSEHMVRWYKVRKRWKTASAKNEERYKGSMTLLKDMFEK